MTSTGIAAAKSRDQVDRLSRRRLRLHRIQQPVDQRFDPLLHPRDRALVQAPSIGRRTRGCIGASLKTRLVVWCS